MGYEVDFLPVGDGAKSGDAIALRFGNLYGPRREQFVMVIDGGNKDSGDAIVDHIRTYYGTDTVDLAVNTHGDGDHSSGLVTVVEQLNVRRLWMHRPWNHSDAIRHLFNDGRITSSGLSDRLIRSLETARELEELAEEMGIPIDEPFSDGIANGQYTWIQILGPSTTYYESLLPHFDEMPEVKEQFAASFGGGVRALLEKAAASVVKVFENWGIETLSEPAEDAVRAENNSSAILLLQVDRRNLLFTGDAGVPALTEAADFADLLGVDLRSCAYSQIPHHGSKRNVGPTILNRIIGPRLDQQNYLKTAIVSAAKNGAPKHPAKKVTNAYQRRGARVLATQGNIIRISSNAPQRDGWGPARPLPFYREVEE